MEPLSFDNTANAFRSKNNSDLKQSHWLFSMMNNPLLVSTGTRLASLALAMHLPINGLIRATIFKQFCGGESLTQSIPVIQQLKAVQVESILDYAVEAKESEAEFEQTTQELLKVIQFASEQNIPFVSVKVTGLARFSLLEKLQAKELCSTEEQEEFRRVKERLRTICQAGSDKQVGILVDAEETWIQDPVDALVNGMMLAFNKEKPVVYNTIQHYRHDRLAYLVKCIQLASENNYIYAIKLVRGAYMEKERLRAQQLNYPSPIQPNKAACDADFDAGVAACLENSQSVAVFIASHNEQSALKATKLMAELNIMPTHPHVHFSQLYGMSDHMTFNLSTAGYNAYKYLPFGPIRDVMPYLIRRAQENTSISGQMSRELRLLKAEMQRRKI
jgi:proline dehydrogenase